MYSFSLCVLTIILISDENQEYFVKLKALIEDTYEQNSQERIMMIAHSMGGPMSQYFLNLQTQEWKDKYIKCLVSLSGAWGGSVKAIKVYAIGMSTFISKNYFIRLKSL